MAMRRRTDDMAVVMSVEGTEAIVLTRTGAFERVRIPHGAAVGDIIPWQAYAAERSTHTKSFGQTRSARRLSSRWGMIGAAAVVAVASLIVTSVVTTSTNKDVYAYVSLDANGQVSFDVDKNMHVVDVKGLNKLGQQTVSTMKLSGASLNSAVDDVVAHLASNKLLPHHDTIVVTAASATDNSDVHSVETAAVTAVHQALQGSSQSDSVNDSVYSMDVPREVWIQAEDDHVSPGQYATYLLAQQVGVPVKLADLNSSNLQTVFAEAHDLHTALTGLNTGNYDQVASIVEGAIGASGSSQSGSPTESQS